MKKYLLSLMFTLATAALFAQPEVPNQNPNFRISRTRYMAAKDSLLSTQGTTLQNTYKAYDWMQLRQDRKDIRFQNRQQRRLNRSIYGGYNYYNNGVVPYNYYPGNYNNRFYGNGFYGNNYRNRYYNNRPSRFSDHLWWFLF